MRLQNRFTVPAECTRTWDFLTDLRNIVPCLPGASIDATDGSRTSGTIALRIGPMIAEYAGHARFVVRDDDNKLATIEATGTDARSGGTATARIRARLAPLPEGTLVDLATEVNLTGRVAQLGRAPIDELSTKLTDEFAQHLATRLMGTENGDAVALPDDRRRTWATKTAAGAGFVVALLLLGELARRLIRRGALR